MNTIQNQYKNVRVEFHILQSFPVSCLNRDDVGAPKTAQIGGSTRARVSSQCWKRQVRLAMHELGIVHGDRTKLIANLVARGCEELGASPDQARNCGSKIEQIFIKKSEAGKKGGKSIEEEDVEPSEKDKTDTLLFLSPKEVSTLANVFKKAGFVPELVITQEKPKGQVKEVEGLIGKITEEMDALDIALFGRMVAQAAELNVEAAASFAHAISTHKVANEVEFFTALDDLSEEPGSAHMGSLEFNAATYYRYVSLDMGQLVQTLGSDDRINPAVDTFVKALYTAVPSARQTTQSAASPWEFAKVFVRKGQRLQVPFETAIKADQGGFLKPSIAALTEYLVKKEKLYGSLFGKIAEFTFGENVDFNIDKLVDAIKEAIAKAKVKA